MRRVLIFLYGAIAYALFFGVFCYAAGFVGNLVVPKSIDSGPTAPLAESLLVNLGLLGLFAVQHTAMARRGFKRWITRFLPQPIERATYVLATNVCFILLFALWRPLPATVWHVEGELGRAALWTLYAGGWVTAFLATVMINHFELFGLRQVWRHLRGQGPGDLGFRVPGLYQWVRHPIQLGFLIAFWATPHMTVGRLLFAVGTTGYILIALKLFEERDLVRDFGERYRGYMRQVSMFLPLRRYRPAPARR